MDRVTAELHDALYLGAIELFEPYFVVAGGVAPTTEADVQQVIRACDLIERVLAIHPENWNAAWTMGMARRAVGDYSRSYDALRQAYALAPTNETVAREQVIACLIAHRDEEALVVALDAVTRDPENAALTSNLALAYLLAGRLEEAAAAIVAATRLDQDDVIIGRLRMVIGNLALGQPEEAERLAAMLVERAPTDPVVARVFEVAHRARDNHEDGR